MNDKTLREQGSDHYKNLKLQPWDAMEHWGHPIEFFGFLRYCAVKRLARLEEKGEIEKDLTKSIHELQKMLEWYQANRGSIDEVLGLVQVESTEIGSWSWASKWLAKGSRVRRAKWPRVKSITQRLDEYGEPIYVDLQSIVYTLTMEDLAATDWTTAG